MDLQNKKDIIINALAVFLFFVGVYFFIGEIKEDELNYLVIGFCFIPIILAYGIFKRKELARKICIWFFWIVGIAVIFAALCLDYDIIDLWKNIFMILIFLVPLALFLMSSKIKESFK